MTAMELLYAIGLAVRMSGMTSPTPRGIRTDTAVLCCGLSQELYVDHNKLQTLPLSLTKLTNLRRL